MSCRAGTSGEAITGSLDRGRKLLLLEKMTQQNLGEEFSVPTFIKICP